MAIYLPIPMEPFDGTEEQWNAYQKVQETAVEAYMAYGAMMGIFAIFSPRRRKVFDQAMDGYHEAYDQYRELMGWVKADN